MVLTACQKQLDQLYHDDMLDVSTDIDVLEQMLRRDGYTDTAFSPGAATAAAAQLEKQDAPILKTGKGTDDDFVSFYSQHRGHQE